MYQNRPRRFRRRPIGSNHQSRNNGDMGVRQLRSNSFSNNQARNNLRAPQSAEKLLEKYNALAKEALVLGDKSLSENYFQHADHYMRIIENLKNRNQNQNQNKVQIDDKLAASNKHLVENSGISQNKVIEEKKEKKE